MTGMLKISYAVLLEPHVHVNTTKEIAVEKGTEIGSVNTVIETEKGRVIERDTTGIERGDERNMPAEWVWKINGREIVGDK